MKILREMCQSVFRLNQTQGSESEVVSDYNVMKVKVFFFLSSFTDKVLYKCIFPNKKKKGPVLAIAPFTAWP